MSVTPEKDPNYIYAHPYATLIADEYRMRGGYCIVRPGGTDDHLMLLTHAGRALAVTLRAHVHRRFRRLAAGVRGKLPSGIRQAAPGDDERLREGGVVRGRICRSALLLAAVPPRLRSAAARDCKAWTESTATQPRLNHPSCRIQERFRHNHHTFVILQLRQQPQPNDAPILTPLHPPSPQSPC